MLTVHLRINDATTNRPVPVRVCVTDADGTHYAPLGKFADFPIGRSEDVGAQLRVGRERWFYIDGACEIPLPAGVPLRVQAAKGPDWIPLDEPVTLGSGQISLRFAIARRENGLPNDWVSVDTRCHFLSPHAALLEAQAEDLHAVNLLATPLPLLALDANTYTTTPNLVAFSGQVSALERENSRVIVNTFNAHPVLGKVALLNSHRPVFPLTFGGEESDDWGICDWCDQCHRKKGLVVWVDAFESVAGLVGGEALVAAILGKIDAIEMSVKPRKSPLLPWLYRLWNAGILVPVVGASGKDSNAIRLGAMRTYAHTASDSWVEAVRAGRTTASNGSFATLEMDDTRVRVIANANAELVANGHVIASVASDTAVTWSEPGWLAARVIADGFAHSSPIAPVSPRRDPHAVAVLRGLIDQTRDWVESQGRFHNPKRKQSILDHCAEAVQKLEANA
jgi:hypothetical protein